MTTPARTRFIEHQGRAIVLMDFSGIREEAVAMQAIAEAKAFVAAQPRIRNLLTLVDVTGAVATPPLIEKLKDLARHNTPWVLAGSVVGVSMVLRLLMRIITAVTGRKLATFRTLDDAKAWLVKQKAPPQEVPEEWIETPQ